MHYELDGRTAIVTGGGGGLGGAVARTLSASGAAVLVADLDADAAEEVAAGIRAVGGRAESFAVDVTDPVAAEAMVARCVEAFGGLHIAVNNAGVHGDTSNPATADYPVDQWDRAIAINLNSVFYCLRAEVPAMRDTGARGAIVNMASVFGAVAGQGVAGYVAAKHGVVGLTRAAALDHAADGIRVNAVGPGFIDTGLVRRHIPEEARPEFAALHPLGRLGEAQEVAELVAFLASDAASFMTGNYYPVEGGYLAR